ncbi:YSIRK-type signal peptide-containing protein, partial [Streptococcus mitis]|uniref:YSIRK-type signal peptide-containing protein n=1 Tax=Streptococcus mitis TaxID=28037 RepID=UPI00352EDD01
MKQWFYGEKRQRFSFRKLSVGLVSATIGSFFFSSLIAGDLSPVKATEISHGQSAQVSYYYVMESELTEAEKSILIREIPKHVEEISESYYLVYRPKDQKLGYGALPQTGYSGVWESIFAVAGFTFLVLIFARAKNGKRYLSSILLVTGMGSVLLSPTALAVTNIELAAYNQSINLGVGESLPKPLHIDGFEYIGYLKNEDKRGNSLSSSHKNKSLVDYGTNPDTAPVHEVPELVEYGTSPDTAPVHEVPELAEYGTSPDTAPVHEAPELAEYGTSPDTAPVHEIPELAEYGTS